MTLADILPSLATSVPPHLDPEIWPLTTRWGVHGGLEVGGTSLERVVADYGAPVRVLDETDVRARAIGYAAAFGRGGCSYSAKAGLTVTTGRWIAEAGLGCYVTSADQLRTALLAGFPPAGLVLCSAGKSVADLDAAFACGAAVVVGSAAEAATVAGRAPSGQRVLLRVLPASPGRPHGYGLRLGTSTAFTALDVILRSGLVLDGLDCSLGHQLARFGGYERCLREAIAFLAVVRARRGFSIPMINLGGGHAVPYRDGEDGLALGAFAARLRGVARVTAERYDLRPPAVRVSPGRALIARAGVTVAFADVSAADQEPPCCPNRHTTVAFGNLVATAGTGAYHHEDIPYVGRPALVSVSGGRARTLVRRVTLNDLMHI
jgi:diaminopimelate decarboxylase